MAEKQVSKLARVVVALRAIFWCAGACLGLTLGTFRGLAQSPNDDAIPVVGKRLPQHETPFMCSIEKALTKEQRAHKKALSEKMESARTDTVEIPDGYVFRFRPEAISFAEIADWVATERVCCPFFDLAIEAERESGPISLRITGRDGVKNFIRGEFHTLKLK